MTLSPVWARMAGLGLLLVLAIDIVLVASLLEGAALLRSVEAGRALSCNELYNNPVLNGAFTGWRGALVYAFGLFAMPWLLVTVLSAMTFSALWETSPWRRLLPLAMMAALLIALVALWPTALDLRCALE